MYFLYFQTVLSSTVQQGIMSYLWSLLCLLFALKIRNRFFKIYCLVTKDLLYFIISILTQVIISQHIYTSNLNLPGFNFTHSDYFILVSAGVISFFPLHLTFLFPLYRIDDWSGNSLPFCVTLYLFWPNSFPCMQTFALTLWAALSSPEG